MTLKNIIEITRRKDIQEVHGDSEPIELKPSRIEWFYKKWGYDYQPRFTEDMPETKYKEMSD